MKINKKWIIKISLFYVFLFITFNCTTKKKDNKNDKKKKNILNYYNPNACECDNKIYLGIQNNNLYLILVYDIKTEKLLFENIKLFKYKQNYIVNPIASDIYNIDSSNPILDTLIYQNGSVSANILNNDIPKKIVVDIDAEFRSKDEKYFFKKLDTIIVGTGCPG